MVQAAKPLPLTARQTGQVFTIALDDAIPPNICAAAMSAYGLPIAAPDADGDGQPDRAVQGGPLAERRTRKSGANFVRTFSER